MSRIGTIIGFAGTPLSGHGCLFVEVDKVVQPIMCDNPSTVRALGDCFGDVVDDMRVNNDAIRGKKIEFQIDWMGMLRMVYSSGRGIAMLAAIFCVDDSERRELVKKIRTQFDEVLSISELDEDVINQIIRRNKTALIECRSHRQIPRELSHLIEPVVIAQEKRAIVSDCYCGFSLPLDELAKIDIPFGDYHVYERRYERRNLFRKLLRGISNRKSMHPQMN